ILALSNRDTNGSPILSPNPLTTGSVGQILGRPVFRSGNAQDADTNTVGVAGDWDYARYGVVEAVSIDISDNPVFNAHGTLDTAGWLHTRLGAGLKISFAILSDDNMCGRLKSQRVAIFRGVAATQWAGVPPATKGDGRDPTRSSFHLARRAP